MQPTRRSFLKTSAVVAGGTMLPSFSIARAEGQTPHFFLLVTVSGGVDASYLWDARSLKMTDKNKITNYLYKNATTSERTIPIGTVRNVK